MGNVARKGDGYWSASGCWPPPPVPTEWYGVPGQGSYLRTQRFGTYWVGGGIYQRFAQSNYECGALGPPVKEYMWLSEFNAWGQWFYGGAIYYRDGYWQVAIGDWGQTAGRDTEIQEVEPPDDAEQPPDPPGTPPPLPDVD